MYDASLISKSAVNHSLKSRIPLLSVRTVRQNAADTQPGLHGVQQSLQAAKLNAYQRHWHVMSVEIGLTSVRPKQSVIGSSPQFSMSMGRHAKVEFCDHSFVLTDILMAI